MKDESKIDNRQSTIGLTRRELCKTGAVMSAMLAQAANAEPFPNTQPPRHPTPDTRHPTLSEPAGSWPTPRQNRCLTGVQPLPGKMRQAPKIEAKLAFGTTRAAQIPLPDHPDRFLSLVDGALRCHRSDGKRLWSLHPAGLNFTAIMAVEDLDGDGKVEIVLTAGRPTDPLGAMVLVSANTGAVLFRYDVEPMSYWWTLKVDHYLPGATAKQILVCEHGYPPDEKFGYIVLFEFLKPGAAPRLRWRYDFDHYTCFPNLLTADVDGDGINELCVECHSHMWIVKTQTGQIHQYLEWDVSPANVRSYGLVRLQDLNGDGLPEFFCIANFAQHHEVLRNEQGMFKLVWAHGWDNSVTTSKIATTWPEPPIADVDGDGKLEMIVSMYHADAEPRWMIRIYDAMTGVLKATVRDRIATALIDIDGDGRAEILADISTDPTRTAVSAACLLKSTGNVCDELWRLEGAASAPIEARSGEAAERLLQAVYIRTEGKDRRLVWSREQGALLTNESPPARPAGPDVSHIPAEVGVPVGPTLVADVDGDGKNEIIHYHQGKVTLYRYTRAHGFTVLDAFASDGEPALADVDADGRLELIVGSVSPITDPIITVYKPGASRDPLWQVTLKRPDRIGMPYPGGHALYFQTGRFTGRNGYDIYVYVSTPLVRSLMLDGHDGHVLWEKGEIAGIERYFAPTVNQASVWDVNGDGIDDLVFTCPDYYCVAHGTTGAALIGPAFPPKIFHQPSQGLYTLPAILPHASDIPLVCLVDGHYFRAGMSVKAEGLWYQLPNVGEAHAGAEGFLKTQEGHWLMGFGRQDGKFACLDAATGKLLWEYPLSASAGDVSACDIDGDGRQEFVFGTSHGDLYALADRDGKPHLVWKAKLPAGVGSPVIADVDGDGASELLVALNDGSLCLLNI